MARSSHYRPPNLNRDRARPRNVPAPASPLMEQHLSEVLWPIVSRQEPAYREAGLRDRMLGLPVMVGVILSLIWRQIPSVSELARVLKREHLLWATPRTVSQQALSLRLRTLPAALFSTIVAELLPVLHERAQHRPATCPPLLTRLRQQVGAIWAIDGSTLEEVGKKVNASSSPWAGLGGRIEAVLDLTTRLPVQLWLSTDPKVSDKQYFGLIQELLPPRSLVVVDRGFFAFTWFDWMTDHDHWFITRAQTHTRFTVEQTMTDTDEICDQIVALGVYRSNPCQQPVRRVVLGTRVYLTNWLDPQTLAAHEIGEMYAQRWRIEELFLQTKRLLGLSYLWSADANAIALQVWASWLLYAVLIDLCSETATRLEVPLSRISIEMAMRGLYHFQVAVEHGYSGDAVTYFCDPDNSDLHILKPETHPPLPRAPTLNL